MGLERDDGSGCRAAVLAAVGMWTVSLPDVAREVRLIIRFCVVPGEKHVAEHTPRAACSRKHRPEVTGSNDHTPARAVECVSRNRRPIDTVHRATSAATAAATPVAWERFLRHLEVVQVSEIYIYLGSRPPGMRLDDPCSFPSCRVGTSRPVDSPSGDADEVNRKSSGRSCRRQPTC